MSDPIMNQQDQSGTVGAKSVSDVSVVILD